MIPLTHYIILSAGMFAIGLYGVITRRNAVGILISVELILNAANINLVAFGQETFAIFVIAIAAAAACVGLALIISVYRNSKTIYLDNINLLKG